MFLNSAKIKREQFEAISIGFGGLIGESAKMRRVYDLIGSVSRNSCAVLLLGETGTGKELVARTIHLAGPWRNGPFVPVDCAALSPGLIESELFGHVRGAFTGAERTRKGLLEAANGGVLFLDEIGELDISLQAKLLRAIQEREVRPVGSLNCVPLRVRLISATHRDLRTAVEKGTFRQDLFFRVNVVELDLPPLREHRNDIPQLVRHFVEKFTGTGEETKTVSDQAMALLTAGNWPGNVRELGNVVECAMALSVGPTIERGDLPDRFQTAACEQLPAEGLTLPLFELERRAIRVALRQAGGHKVTAAHALQIGKTTLYRKLRQYDAGRI